MRRLFGDQGNSLLNGFIKVSIQRMRKKGEKEKKKVEKRKL